ncbi:hypothetical protein NSK_008256 [Nannochloropsis salina CCMP1776]|uniref:Uncharacterized protein n=1 Tax=Nannochloropsis salina CCMP1776 TaxID=1027361 RepID=A0A4D9CSE0_9STRA|nr:hypothetical protein NSK_008256 [Nannochloropsis salina CCMP1776]|eukprot:TFJ80515.1 hypothetical protein NSK_008256 [Nannochloropsis salina CCMP1776]
MEPEGRKALNLRVCTADDHKTLFSVLPVVQGGWVLDICLDYFSTQNPFLVALEEDQGPAAREAVLAYFQAPHFRRKEALEAVPEEVKAEEKVLDALRTIQLLGPLRVLAHYLALEEEELGGE